MGGNKEEKTGEDRRKGEERGGGRTRVRGTALRAVLGKEGQRMKKPI